MRTLSSTPEWTKEWTEEWRKWKCMFYHTQNGVMHLDGAKPGKKLYRGQPETHLPEEMVTAIRKFKKGQAPQTFHWPFFASTSELRDVAVRKFCGTEGPNRVIFEIEHDDHGIIHGLGAGLVGLSEFPTEAEVLLPPGASFRVTSGKETIDEHGPLLEVGLKFVGFHVMNQVNGAECDTLRDKLARLKKEIRSLRRRNAELEEENAELRQQSGRCERCEQVQDEVNHLMRQNRELEEENKALQDENARLRATRRPRRARSRSPSPIRAITPSPVYRYQYGGDGGGASGAEVVRQTPGAVSPDGLSRTRTLALDVVR
jgi:cell division protein FtsB